MTTVTDPPTGARIDKVPTFDWDELREEKRETIEQRVIALLDKVPGLWIRNLPMERYLQIDAMSASGLWAFKKNPAEFRYQRDNPKEPTKAMKEGSAVHTALLEPEEFDDRYVVIGRCEGTKNDGDRCTYNGKVYRDGQSFCKTHDPMDGAPMEPGIEVVTEEALERFKAAKKAVMDHEKASQFFRGRRDAEVTGVWRDPHTGLPCKMRPDIDLERVDLYADLKWTNNASESGFYRTARRMGYLWRSQWYRRGMDVLKRPAEGSVLIAVEQQPPHGVQTFLLDEDELADIDPYIDDLMERYGECREQDEWPGYPERLTRLSLLRDWDLPDDDDLEDFEDEEG